MVACRDTEDSRKEEEDRKESHTSCCTVGDHEPIVPLVDDSETVGYMSKQNDENLQR